MNVVDISMSLLEPQDKPILDERQQRFATSAARYLRSVPDCRFSLLPAPELARIAVQWYAAASEAMMQGNDFYIDRLIREQARQAAGEGFTFDDLVQLLQVCRKTATECYGWTEEALVPLDTMIDEVLNNLRHVVVWKIPEKFNYVAGMGGAEGAAEQSPGEDRGPRKERRALARAKLRLPIRVRGRIRTGSIDDVTHTVNVSRGGLYFHSKKKYAPGMKVDVMYPYWDSPGAINKVYPAVVARVDEEKGPLGAQGVALRFLVRLGTQTFPTGWQ